MSGLSSEESSLGRMRFKQARCPELFDELEIRGSTPAGEHESLDYDSVFNRGYLEEFRQQQGRRQWFGYSGATLRRWVLTVLVGILIGLIFVSWNKIGCLDHVISHSEYTRSA